jgi:hypothetical protein
MAQTLIRGTTQIRDGTISTAKLAAGWDTPFVRRDGTAAATADQAMGGFKITGLADGTAVNHAVTVGQLQAYSAGVGTRANVRAVATTNLALTGAQTVDGVSLTGAADDFVVLTAQTTASQNGPWKVNAAAWARPTWWAAASSQKPALFFVTEGTTFDNTKWTTLTNGTIVVDTTAVSITQDTSGSTYTNGNGLSLTGNTFAVKLANGLSFDGTQNVQVVGEAARLITVAAGGVGITNGTAGQLVVANGSTNAAWATMSGDATLSSAGAITVNATSTGFTKYSNIVTNEVPTGAINGANTTFTVAFTPVAGLCLYHNGVRLFPGAGNDYTVAGTTITMLFTPQTLDTLTADYIK